MLSTTTTGPKANYTPSYEELGKAWDNFYVAAKKMALHVQVFAVKQHAFVKRNDERLHKIMLAAFALQLLYMGGLSAVITFTACAIGEGMCAGKVNAFLEKIPSIWNESMTIRLAMCAGGMMLFVNYPWIIAAGALGIYTADFFNNTGRSQPDQGDEPAGTEQESVYSEPESTYAEQKLTYSEQEFIDSDQEPTYEEQEPSQTSPPEMFKSWLFVNKF